MKAGRRFLRLFCVKVVNLNYLHVHFDHKCTVSRYLFPDTHVWIHDMSIVPTKHLRAQHTRHNPQKRSVSKVVHDSYKHKPILFQCLLSSCNLLWHALFLFQVSKLVHQNKKLTFFWKNSKMKKTLLEDDFFLVFHFFFLLWPGRFSRLPPQQRFPVPAIFSGGGGSQASDPFRRSQVMGPRGFLEHLWQEKMCEGLWFDQRSIASKNTEKRESFLKQTNCSKDIFPKAFFIFEKVGKISNWKRWVVRRLFFFLTVPCFFRWYVYVKLWGCSLQDEFIWRWSRYWQTHAIQHTFARTDIWPTLGTAKIWTSSVESRQVHSYIFIR